MKLKLAALAVLLAGCGGSGGGAAAAPAQAEGAVRLQSIGSFDEPLYVTAPPGDERRVFVVEQGGTIRIVRGGEKLGTPFLDLTDRVQSGGEQGLLSMAFAPDYATSGLFYVYYTDSDGNQRVVEYKRGSDDRADPGSARQLLLMRDEEPNHNGGLLLFGPDRLLYIGTGDGGGGGDQHGARGNGQALGTLLGKILRIDPRASGGRPYSVPRSNPFVGRSGARGEIYSYGLRNPWRFSFDRSTGDLSIGDVGQNEVEEISFVRRGRGPRGELRLAPVRGQRPLRGGRARARAHPAGHHRAPLRRQLLDHRRRRHPRPGPAGVARTLRLRRPLPRRAPDRRALTRPGPQQDRPRPARRAALLVRRGCPGARLRDIAERAGLPAGAAVITRILARNASPLTLTGTNTWVVGRDPAWVVDPGPLLDAHVDAVAAEVAARGGAGGIALTHSHSDHSDAIPALQERLGGVPLGSFDTLADGDTFGPFDVLAIPGHADDHLVFVAGRTAFTGDTVLGQGSVFVSGRLREYLAGLRRLRALDLERICPGHGDEVTDPAAKLDEYFAHRAEREEMLLAALAAGAETEDELLDAAWADAPPIVRPFAAQSLRAHMDKLREENRLPAG